MYANNYTTVRFTMAGTNGDHMETRQKARQWATRPRPLIRVRRHSQSRRTEWQKTQLHPQQEPQLVEWEPGQPGVTWEESQAAGLKMDLDEVTNASGQPERP